MDIRIDAVAELVDIAQVKPYEKNPKKHPPGQIEALASRIRKDGFDQPIVVDEDFIILKGHGRRLAALRLGMKQVPVIIKTGLTEEHKTACRIADNKLAEGEWEIDLLKEQMKSLQLAEYDLSDMGFNAKELDDFKLDNPLDDPEEENFQREPGSLGSNPVISYQIIFDDEAQQQRWYAFMKGLKQEYPDMETAAQRLIEFIDANWGGPV
jgi:hypothetical protein